MAKLSSLAAEYGGFVANPQTQSGAGSVGRRAGRSRCRSRWPSFSAALDEAQSLGKTSNLTTKATDVTGQYVDLQAQITSLEASRQQYLTIMTKASSIGDVLAVQAQLDTPPVADPAAAGAAPGPLERDGVLHADRDGP